MDSQLSAQELENVSERRNELIAKLFHDVHYVENRGRGISKILSFEPDTDFKEIGTHFIAVFRRKTEESLKTVDEKWSDRVGENEAKILDLISKNRYITYVELAHRLDITEKSIYMNIEKLRKKGLIKRVGPAKGGYWEVLE